jgi:hypothetical protein
MWLTAFFLASAAIFVPVESACPHEGSSLKKISTLYDSFPVSFISSARVYSQYYFDVAATDFKNKTLYVMIVKKN